jgi:hypothetical protein
MLFFSKPAPHRRTDPQNHGLDTHSSLHPERKLICADPLCAR